jgi:hypothetical protein
LGVEPWRARLLGWWTAGIWPPCLLLLLEILWRGHLLAARHGALLALIVSICLTAIAGARARRSELVAVVASWRGALWRSLGRGSLQV